MGRDRRMKLNAVVFLLVDEDRRMLLQQRSLDAPVMPGCWAFFGGGIEPDETPLEALKREAREEIDYWMKDPCYVFEQDFTLDNADGHVRVFVEKFKGDKKSLMLKEGFGWGWFTAGETKKLKMMPHDRVTIQKVEDYIQQSAILRR